MGVARMLIEVITATVTEESRRKAIIEKHLILLRKDIGRTTTCIVLTE
jgi:hypothetical protein